MSKGLLRRCGWVLVAAGLLAAVGFPLRLAQYVHRPRGTGEVAFRVAPGSGTAALADTLAACGIAPWRWGTRVGFRLWGAPAGLKAGNYALAAPVRLVDVYAAVVAGRVALVTVTLPEGLTAREMAPLLERAGVTAAQDFLDLAYDSAAPGRWGLPGPSLEGFLFPDTYRFAQGLPAVRVVDAMVRRFHEVTRPYAAELESGGGALLPWVTLASVVEKESGRADEKPIIAGVMHNRLARNMRLESDPTVIYGIEDFDGNLRRRDLRADTPYNTYVRRGLPPGPIANPGRASLEAVLRPAEVPYLYFVSRNDGSHEFSKTYDEHRAAVRRYQLKGR